MSQEKSLTFVSLLGSLRKGSFNAVVARNLASLAPDGVAISPLGYVGELPHYDADLQAAGFPGALKNALSVSRLPDTPVAGKPIAIITASPGAIGGARAQYHLRQTLVFLDGRVLNKPEVIIGQAASRLDPQTGQISDADSRNLISAQLTALAAIAARPD